MAHVLGSDDERMNILASWEDRFRKWAVGPGETKHERFEHAEGMIRKAIAASSDLKYLDIEVFSQGSFKNATNIPQESDVDVSVCLKENFYYKLPDGADPKNYGLTPTTHEYGSYKKSVVKAIKDYFGSDKMTVGNKAIRVHSNSYRIDADVVPNWLYREYFPSGSTRDGVKFIADDGQVIINYPKQHIEQGVKKNGDTSKRFKRMARICKSLQVVMLEEGKLTERLPSFFLESLVYNAPNDKFGNSTYEADVRAVLLHIYQHTRASDDPSKWLEVNGVKYLFHANQPWTKAEANAFVTAAWNYVGFK